MLDIGDARGRLIIQRRLGGHRRRPRSPTDAESIALSGDRGLAGAFGRN